MNVLSIQSWVAYGHVGNASAVFPLQRMGVEVWAVNTVQFSNHTGYGQWKGQVYTGDSIRDLITGIDERGVLPSCDGVLSGYMGDAGIGEAILDAVGRVRAANSKAIYCCDPVIGDVGRGVFVRPGIPEFMRDRAVRAANVVTPNLFELQYLSGREINNRTDLAEAIRDVHALGPEIIMVTSVQTDETPGDSADVVLSDGSSLLRIRTPLLPININGAGDAIAALFLGKLLQDGSPEGALVHAVSATYGLLKRTAAAGSREILTVAAQDEFVSPSKLFTVEHLNAW
ncbi:MAG: pyridoxal kinase PdxY [Methylobacterium mesophilicum]|nr:pyridoxal kinase PdxY [Methylobacterium mesophilicum]